MWRERIEWASIYAEEARNKESVKPFSTVSGVMLEPRVWDLEEGKSTFQAGSIRKQLATVMLLCATIFASHFLSPGGGENSYIKEKGMNP